MIERKAIFISEDKLTNIFSENKTLVVFDLENNHVIGVETIVLKKKFNSTEEILHYLQRKYINLVYVSVMDIETEIKFSNFNIRRTAVKLYVQLIVCRLHILAETAYLSWYPVLLTDIVDDCTLYFKVGIGFKFYILLRVEGIDGTD